MLNIADPATALDFDCALAARAGIHEQGELEGAAHQPDASPLAVLFTLLSLRL